MAEPADLLGKADALMARHRPARPGTEPQAEIPVLHEVVHLHGEHDPEPLMTEAAAAAPDQVQFDALTQGLLAQLQFTVDEAIEARLKEKLEPLVETMFNDLRAELQAIARQILNEAIGKAVEDELGRRESGG